MQSLKMMQDPELLKDISFYYYIIKLDLNYKSHFKWCFRESISFQMSHQRHLKLQHKRQQESADFQWTDAQTTHQTSRIWYLEGMRSPLKWLLSSGHLTSTPLRWPPLQVPSEVTLINFCRQQTKGKRCISLLTREPWPRTCQRLRPRLISNCKK